MDSPYDSATGGAGASVPPRRARERGSLGATIADGWHELRGLFREHAVLAVLEAQRAGLRFALLVAIALVVGVLMVTAWLTLVTALMVWLLGEGLSWPAVLVAAAVLNIAIAGVLVWVAAKRLAELPFQATLRQLSADKAEIRSQMPGGGDG